MAGMCHNMPLSPATLPPPPLLLSTLNIPLLLQYTMNEVYLMTSISTITIIFLIIAPALQLHYLFFNSQIYVLSFIWRFRV